MDKFLELVKGKKTYITAIVLVVLGCLEGLNVFVVPEWAWAVSGALGLTFLRAGVKDVSNTVRDSKPVSQ